MRVCRHRRHAGATRCRHAGRYAVQLRRRCAATAAAEARAARARMMPRQHAAAANAFAAARHHADAVRRCANARHVACLRAADAASGSAVSRAAAAARSAPPMFASRLSCLLPPSFFTPVFAVPHFIIAATALYRLCHCRFTFSPPECHLHAFQIATLRPPCRHLPRPRHAADAAPPPFTPLPRQHFTPFA